jgi:hypothetical protein
MRAQMHLPEKVILPRQVLIIGDGQAEKRSYDEHGNQAQTYSTQPGHAAVANVGLKGLFLKDGPSFDELVLQQRWATAHVASTFLPTNDLRPMMWDLTGFPEWVCSLKAGANAYQPIYQGSLLTEVQGALSGEARMRLDTPMEDSPLSGEDADEAMQMAIAMSMSSQGGSGAPQPPPAPPSSNPASSALQAETDKNAESEEERAMQEAIALSLK